MSLCLLIVPDEASYGELWLWLMRTLSTSLMCSEEFFGVYSDVYFDCETP